MNEIFAIVIIVLALTIALIIVVQYFIKKMNFTESMLIQGELKKQRQEYFLSHRMEAYQRAILYMERINPAALVMRMNQQNLNAVLFQSMLLKAIRDEYDHNVGQQMFISHASWNLLKNAKEETAKLINIAASQLTADATSNELSTVIITLTAEVSPLPSEIAIEALKAEFQQFL